MRTRSVTLFCNIVIFLTIHLFLFTVNANANTATTSVSLDAYTATYLELIVEPDEVAMTVQITQGSGDIDLYLKKGSPAMGSSTSEISANADFASEGISWNETINVDQSTSPALSSGSWYVTLVNLNDYAVSVTVQVTSETQSPDGQTGGSSTASNLHFKPQTGLWYNKSQPGHGIDFEMSGNNLTAVWYTYNTDSTPTWYLATAPLTGGTWTATLNKYHWDGSSATPTPVGTVTVNFSTRTQATFSWTLNGQSGSEPIERFVLNDQIPPSNYTGLWYNSAEPGYGYSIDTQGNAEAIVAYFYDNQGQPRWALTSSTNSDMTSPQTLPVSVFFGPCPNCAGSNFYSTSGGTIYREYLDATHATIAANIVLPDPMNASWNKPSAQNSLLSSQVDNKRLELEMAIDSVIGYLSEGDDTLEGFSDIFSSLDIESSTSTCPVITTSNSGTSLSDPMRVDLTADFGSGCTDQKGNTWSGKIIATVDLNLGSAIHADFTINIDNLHKNGELVAQGSASGNLDLSLSESSSLANGSGTLTLNLTGPENKPVSGTITIAINNIDIGSLTDESGSFSLASLLNAIGTNGAITITFNNVIYGETNISGTITGQATAIGNGQVDLNLQTTAGPITGSITVRQGSTNTDYLLNTVGTANILGYNVTFNNIEFNSDICTKSPVGGELILTKGSNSGKFTFDSSCLGYSYEPL